MPFNFKRLEIPKVILVTPTIFEDNRGFFMEAYKQSEFEKNGISTDFVQDNHSKSNKGVLRGLHYQLNPKPQGKLVRVVRGALIDVVVDIRKGSPFYGKWISVKLSAENNQILWIPPGFAHGVYILEDNTELLYKISGAEYESKFERGILWNDPEIGIIWPDNNPQLSERDIKYPLLKDVENNFIYEEEKQ